MYRIAWKSLHTGAYGHGQYVLTYEQVTEIVADYNKKNNNSIVHWFEHAPPPKLNLSGKGHYCSYGMPGFVPHYSPISPSSLEQSPLSR